MEAEGNSGRRLGELFMRLAEDSELLERYLEDPVAVMTEYGVGEDVIALVMEADVRKVYAVLKDAYAGRDVILGTIVHG
jgi:hypothetical protein